MEQTDLIRLQESVTELSKNVSQIKHALLGDEYNEHHGLIYSVSKIRADVEGNCGIVDELVRWKSEAQIWKEKAEQRISFFEQLRWKAVGVILAISIIFPLIWDFLKKKLFGI